MRNLLLTVLLFSISFFTANAQKTGIIAGMNNDSVYYFDIPDTTIPGNSNNFYLDLDADGINDFRFKYSYSQGTGNRSSSITIDPYRDNEVCYYRVDTQYIDSTNFICRNVAKPFNSGEVIHGAYSFDTATTWINGYESGVYGHLEGYNIDDWLGIGDRNIGLKMSIHDTMVYAWIKVNIFFDWGVDYITIKECAYAKKKTTEIFEELSENSSIKLYPNPVENNLYIELPKYKAQINASIYNLDGVKVETHSFQNKKNLHFKTDHLTPGVYIIAIENGKDVSYSRFVKK